MTKVVVFGGSGFLGSHLADGLQEAGYDVTLYDITPSPWLRPGQKMVLGSVTDVDAVRDVIKGAKYIYHLAGIADIGRASENPRETIENNVIGSTNIFEACVEHKVERLLFASSIYVYSDKGSFYRVSKQSAELLIEAYAQRYGLEYTILRYGSLYGPRAQEWNGIKRFITQAIREGKIEYPGTGEERREYIHVLDAVRLSIQVLGEEYVNQCLTLTGAQIMTSKEMLSIIKEVSGLPLEIVFSDSGDVYSTSHYGHTPYRYTPKQGRKLMPNSFIDIGQGILNMIEEIHLGSHEQD